MNRNRRGGSNNNLQMINVSRSSKISNGMITPENYQYFERRVCHAYVHDPKTGLCAGCRKAEDDSFHLPGYVNSVSKWSSYKCTSLRKEYAYGKIQFPASKTKTANFIRVANETKAHDMIQYLYSKDGCNLSTPKLILSVTGGAQNFTIPHRMKKAFKEGLIKAAASTGAWIITGGTNTGVMRLVGEAVAEEYPKYSSDEELTVLGIATWGKIAMREKFPTKKNEAKSIFDASFDPISDTVSSQVPKCYYAKETSENEDINIDQNCRQKQPKTSSDVMLDPNHNNFILVDDGSEGSFGKEIEFRASFESELRKGKSLSYYRKRFARKSGKQTLSIKSSYSGGIDDSDQENVPMVLIVVQGGPNTLLTVAESLGQNIPVLILADSKGCADLISNACACNNTDDLENLIEESKMFEKLKGDDKKLKIFNAAKQLRFILSKKSDDLINVFKLDSEEGSQTIELAILRAFLNSRRNRYFENLKLALQWNRVDIAKTDIFTGEEEFTDRQKSNLLEMALIHNKPEFVELLLETGVDLKSFLNKRRLYFLYNSQILREKERKCPLFQLFKRKYYNTRHESLITFYGIGKFLRDYFFEDFKPAFLPTDPCESRDIKNFIIKSNNRESSDACYDHESSDDDFAFGREKVEFPEKNLFVWALMLNRIDLAKIFWQTGEFQISTSLFASHLLKKMAMRLTDLADNLIIEANYFEDAACGVLKLFDEHSDDLINGIILLQKVPYYDDLDCLEMAVEGGCLRFISLSCVQTLITHIWNGDIALKEGFKASLRFSISILTFGFLAPFLVFDKRQSFSTISDSKEKQEELDKARTHLYKNQKLKAIFSMSKSIFDNDNFNWCKCKSEEDDDDDVDLSDDELSDTSLVENEDHELAENQVMQAKKFIPEIAAPDSAMRDEELKKNIFEVYWNRYTSFIAAPKVHFVYETIFYFLFLVLFSYVILCEFNYTGMVAETQLINKTFLDNSTSFYHNISSKLEPIMVKKVIGPSIAEWLLMFWVFSFIFDEVHQFHFSDSDFKFRSKIIKYLDNSWNFFDIAGCLLFIIGISLRFIALVTNENIFISARIILAIDLTVWYLRLLHASIIFKSLGPKLIMIQQMFKDLVFFMMIICIFVCNFGIITQATLYPNNTLNGDLLRSIINKAYWPIYGEMIILDELTEVDETCAADGTCPLESGIWFSYVMLMIYMILANVLLINLLIAMFSSTFEKVQENTDQIWKFQRYRLVFEYVDSSIFPPPISFIGYIITLINYIIKTREQKVTPQENDFVYDKKFAEMYIKNEKNLDSATIDSRLKWNRGKLETLEQKLNEVIDSKAQESNEVNVAINWLMRHFESSDVSPPYITIKQNNHKIGPA